MICCPESWPSFSARDELQTILDTLGADELQVITEIAKRVQRGRVVYGQLDLFADNRDFNKEAREEVEDMLVYFACRWLKGRWQ